MRKETVVLGGIGLLTLALLIGAAFLFSGEQDTPENATPLDSTQVVGDRRHVIGSDSAQVTIVEFADFQCPACASAHPVVKQVLDHYEDNEVQYVFRHFPLPGHQHARPAARAAEAAGEQGKFFEMHDMLFENQTEWSDSNNPEELFAGYARELELDVEAFNQAMENNALAQAIQDDQNAAIELGVNSTPTFFINGVMYPGALSYDRFTEIINEQLQQ